MLPVFQKNKSKGSKAEFDELYRYEDEITYDANINPEGEEVWVTQQVTVTRYEPCLGPETPQYIGGQYKI